MSLSLLELTVVSLYAAIMALLCVFGVHRLWMIAEFRRALRREGARPRAETAEELPFVTLQLPLYNEQYVAARAIDAAAALDYPADRLEIQVLDDSDDATRDVVDGAVARAAARGVSIRALRRPDRTGFKAGALAAGLAGARGEFIAVFDADFVVPRDWLRRVVGEFADPHVGMVQTAWGHLNADETPLTRAQADFLQGHFAIEHRARAGNGHLFNFNGTAGIWRRRAIDDAGGWSADTLTEDLDLSYRAQLAGWRFVYRPDIVVPAELPVELSAYKKQQHRWTKGAIQVAWKLLPPLLTAPGLRLSDRLHAAAHLLCNLTYPLVLLLAFLLLPMIVIRQRHAWTQVAWIDLAVVLLATVSVGVFYVIAQRMEGKSLGRAVARVPLLMAVGIAMAINNARAVMEGLLRIRSPFRRTAKYGSGSAPTGASEAARRVGWAGRAYNSTAGPQAWLEAGMAVYCGGALVYAARFAPWGSWPFVALFAAGFGLGAVYAGCQAIERRRVRASVRQAAGIAPPEPRAISSRSASISPTNW